MAGEGGQEDKGGTETVQDSKIFVWTLSLVAGVGWGDNPWRWINQKARLNSVYLLHRFKALGLSSVHLFHWFTAWGLNLAHCLHWHWNSRLDVVVRAYSWRFPHYLPEGGVVKFSNFSQKRVNDNNFKKCPSICKEMFVIFETDNYKYVGFKNLSETVKSH